MATSRHPLDSIAHERDPSPSRKKKRTNKLDQRERPKDEEFARSIPAPPNLSLKSIRVPALLVDQELKVTWQNRMAIDKLWHGTPAANNGSAAPRLFDLLFESHFQQQVENWRRWVAFFIYQAQCIISQDAFQQQISQMPNRQKDAVSALSADHDGSTDQCTYNARIHQRLNNGQVLTFDIVATDFHEGRLLVFEPDENAAQASALPRSYDIEQRVENLRRHPNPIKTGFGIIAANINNAETLNHEMLADEYSILINNVCERSLETIERFGGVFNKHLDSGFFAYFLPLDEAEDIAMRTIECSLDLKRQIAELSREWKVRKSWSHDIGLNMGIHKANEYIGILRSYAGEMVSSWGSALGLATELSRLARDGQIWSTKSLFKSMDPDTYKQIRFGVMNSNVQRHRVYVQRCFTNIRNLPGYQAGDADAYKGLSAMAVTQIFDRQAGSGFNGPG